MARGKTRASRATIDGSQPFPSLSGGLVCLQAQILRLVELVPLYDEFQARAGRKRGIISEAVQAGQLIATALVPHPLPCDAGQGVAGLHRVHLDQSLLLGLAVSEPVKT